MSNQAPVQYVKGNKATGTAIDILEDIKEETGLQFSYEFVDNYHEYEERMLHHEIDILASINYDYSLNYINTMSVTNAYLKAPLQIVLQKNTDLNALDNKKLAIRKELSSILKSRIEQSSDAVQGAQEEQNSLNGGLITGIVLVAFVVMLLILKKKRKK